MCRRTVSGITPADHVPAADHPSSSGARCGSGRPGGAPPQAGGVPPRPGGAPIGPLWDTSLCPCVRFRERVGAAIAASTPSDTGAVADETSRRRSPFCLVRATVRRCPPPCRATQTPLLLAIGQGSPDDDGRVLLTLPVRRRGWTGGLV